MSSIKVVSIEFNNTPKPKKKPRAVKKQNFKKRQKFHKSVRAINADPVVRSKIIELLKIVNKAKSVIEQLANLREPMEDLRERVLKEIGQEDAIPLVKSLIHKQVYHAYKNLEEGIEVDGRPTKSLSLTSNSYNNAFFTMSYSRRSILFEELGIIMYLTRPLPRRKENSLYHINICVDDLANPKYIYLNYLYQKPPKKK